MFIIILLLKVVLAIIVTFILIKIVQRFDNLASDIAVIPLVLFCTVAAIVFSIASVFLSLPQILGIPVLFLAATTRLRIYEFQSWGRTILYSFIVICGFVISELLLLYAFT